MPYLLDGNNLIGTVRKTSRPSDGDRAALVSEIADRLRRTRARATIFFDGPAGAKPTSLGALTVRTASGMSADDAILGEIRRSRAPADIVVVTADRELSRRSRDAGAKGMAPGDFFARFGAGAPGGERAGAALPVDVDEWLAYFDDERNRD
jgi:rRNA-processing protein FCF1